MQLRPISSIRITSREIPEWKKIPNSSIHRKPLLIYHGAFDASADELSEHLNKIGAVSPAWVYTMYSESHFHSTSHEVLGVVSGSAHLCFGGEENPGRFEPHVVKGDFIIVPAGVAHRLLSETDEVSGPFNMVGAYPKGKSWDMCYGRDDEGPEIRENIEGLEWFDKDPLYG